jgi:Protein of unknown function (DUF2384)
MAVRPAPGEARSPPESGNDITPREADAMLRAVLNLFDRWKLTAIEARRLLGDPSERTYQRWRKGEIAGLPRDTVFRLGTLLGIHKALRYMFSAPERGYAWIRKPNAAFGGHSALDRMLQGAPTALAAVRAYLDAERGGW